ncbi:MAG: hypothetical protein AB7Q37_16545 [Pyrinomonadaceae bacterium]
MSEEIRSVLVITGVTLCIFGVITFVEVFVLRAIQRLEAPKHLYFAASANGIGFILTILISAVLVFLLIAFGASVLGGVGLAMMGTLIGIIVSLVLIPLSLFLVRFFLFRAFKVTDTKFRVLYSLLSSVGVLLTLGVIWALVMIGLSAVS